MAHVVGAQMQQQNIGLIGHQRSTDVFAAAGHKIFDLGAGKKMAVVRRSVRPDQLKRDAG